VIVVSDCHSVRRKRDREDSLHTVEQADYVVVSEKTASICRSVVEMAHQDVRWIYTGAIWFGLALMADQSQSSRVDSSAR